MPERRIPRVNDPGRVGRGKVKFPLREGTDGTVDLVRSGTGAIGLDPVRGIKVEVHSPLTIASGSPHSVTLALAPGLEDRGGVLGPSLSSSVVVQSGKLVATPDASQVTVDDGMTGVGGGTVEDQIARLQLNKESTIDHDADVTALGAMISIVTHRITFCLNESQINAGAEDFLIGSAGTVVGHRMDSASFARLLVTIREPTGAIKPDVSFWLRYYVSFSDVVGDYIPIGLGGTEVTVTISTTGSWSFGDSGWVPLEVFGADFLYLAIISKDEDSSSAPCDIGNVTVLLSKTDG